jgi:hypothetical protein
LHGAGWYVDEAVGSNTLQLAFGQGEQCSQQRSLPVSASAVNSTGGMPKEICITYPYCRLGETDSGLLKDASSA